MAVDRTEPVLQLMTVVEHMGDNAFLGAMVPRLLEEAVTELARGKEIAKAFAPLYEGHMAFVKLVTAAAKESGGVVLVDLTDTLLEVAGKFVTYALYPESAYSVMITRGKGKLKISIGYNPWCNKPRTHNVAKICERHGGGGHPVVGAISLPPDKIGDAKRLAAEIAAELAT
jgi:nanoRNase/pAp phosphatase (c-di-AMP/oligoRNAs hydrolase)